MRGLQSAGPSISTEVGWWLGTDFRLHLKITSLLSPALQPPHCLIYLTHTSPGCLKMLKRDNVKSLTKINHIRGSPLTHQAFHLMMKGYQVGQTQFPFDKSVLTAADHLSFKCLEAVFRISCSITFPRIKVRLAYLPYLGLFLPFLKTGVTFALFQCSGTSPSINLR